MMEEHLETSIQRQEAFDWLYQLVSPKYISMVEQNFEPDSDAVPVFKAFIAYRIAMETTLLYNDPNEYHVNTCHDLKNQLNSQVTKIARRSSNPWLRKCFNDGLKFQPGTVELQLRQNILLDIQKSFNFLRDQILSPEMEQLKSSEKIAFSVQPWMLVPAIAFCIFLALFINFGGAALLLNKDVILGISTAILLGVGVRWTVMSVPGFWRSLQLRWHYGQGLSSTERNHLRHLDPDQLVGGMSNWLNFFNHSKKSNINETWIDLDQWMSQNIDLHKLNKPQQEPQILATPGRPSSWGSLRLFTTDQKVDEKPANDDVAIDFSRPGRYSIGV